MAEKIPSAASVRNPIDLRGDARNEDIVEAIRIISKDDAVGAVVVLASPLDMIDLNSIADGLCSVNRETDIPIAVCFAGGAVAEEAAAKLRRSCIPSFPTPDRAVRALSALRGYRVRSVAGRTELDLPKVSGREHSLKVISEARNEGRVSLSEEEGKAILASYGIPVPPEFTASSRCDAVRAAERIGFPVVMKIISPDIHHKTDVGGVIVGIKNAGEAEDAYETMIARCRTAVPGARIDGVSVQKMASGQEVILSMIRDEQFGPVISFGLGGIYVEIMGEISQAAVPMSEEEMDEMISSTKAFRLLSGARGKPPADMVSLKEIMMRMMRIAEENPELYELEINPVMVGRKDSGSWAVDALATLR
jgi:acetyltransferase